MPCNSPRCRQRWIVGAVLACLGTAGIGPAWGQMDLTRIFTPGVSGDLLVYPRHLNPARQVPGGGAEPGSFNANGISFQNVSGNPAYFNANNLLTRPATLISNEAFWTDPKVGNLMYNGSPFQVAFMGITFQGFEATDTFSFDLAIAAVDDDLPTFSYDDVSYAYLDFQVQDDNFNVATGRLAFGDLATRIDDAFFGTLAGTFPTLNSPRTAYEARFEFSQQELMELLLEQQDSSNPNPPAITPVRFFDINLMSIATQGGTKQFAMDNVVLNAGSRPIETPDALVYQPQNPVGPNTPIYLIIDPLISLDDYPEGSAALAGSAAPGQYQTLTTSSIAAPTNPLQEIFNGIKTVAASVSVASDPSAGGVSVAPVQITPEMLAQVSSLLSGAEQAVGQPIAASSLTSQEQQLLVQTQNNLNSLARDALNALEQNDQAAYEALLQRIEQERVRIALANNAQQAVHSIRMLMISQMRDRAGDPYYMLEGGPGPELFVGYTLNEYLSLMQLEGSAPQLGDTGGYFEFMTDANGRIVDVIAHSWMVGTTDATYVSTFALTVPEPTSMAVIGCVAALGLSRRRR